MKLYNITTGRIGNFKSIKTDGGTMYPSKLTDEILNSYGYYRLKYESMPNSRYYNAEPTSGVVGAEYVVGYTAVEKPLEELIGRMKSELTELAKDKLQKATEKYANAEMAGWETLEQEALVFIDTGTIETSKILKQEADSCGQTYEELSLEVLGNAEGLRQLRNYVVANRYNRKKAIEAFTTVQECIDYEAEPYEYTVTEEDVSGDIDGNLTVGQVQTRYRNNVREW